MLFSCAGSQAYIKSAYFVFGLNGYNIEQFLAYVRDNPIQPSDNLSPEHEDITEYSER